MCLIRLPFKLFSILSSLILWRHYSTRMYISNCSCVGWAEITCSEFEGWYLYLLSWLLLRGHQCGNITILNYVPIKLHKTGIRTGLHIQSSKSNDVFNIYFLVPKILLTKKNIFFTSTVPTPQVLKICPHQIVFAIKVL